MNKKLKNKLILIAIAIICIIAMPNKSNAGLQANKGGTSLVSTTANDFFKTIRRMETQYGTLGKDAQLNDKYVDTTENGIDCHMALNTEWGAAGILAYSMYGTIPTSSNDTTTGNASGIYQMGYSKYEYVAGIYSTTNSYTNIIESADSRYYNKYESSGTTIAGDGLGKFGYSIDTLSASYPIFERSSSGVLYSYSISGSSDSNYGSRAVVVCGAGL